MFQYLKITQKGSCFLASRQIPQNTKPLSVTRANCQCLCAFFVAGGFDHVVGVKKRDAGYGGFLTVLAALPGALWIAHYYCG